MTWQEIVKEQEEHNLSAELKTAIALRKTKPAIAKQILDAAKKEIDKTIVNKNIPQKQDKKKDVLNKLTQNVNATITPEEQRELNKESKDFRLILADHDLIELDEALFGLIKDKPKYVKYKYIHPSSNIAVYGVGEIIDNKIKKAGFDFYKSTKGTFKFAPTDRTIDLKFKTQDLVEDEYKYAYELIKDYPLAKSVEA
jgi:hypothetical protein